MSDDHTVVFRTRYKVPSGSPPNVIKFHKVRRKGRYVSSSCVAYGVQAYQPDCVVAYIVVHWTITQI